MKNKVILIVAVLFALSVALGTATAVQATEIYPQGTIPSGTVVDDDVVLQGENVVMDGTVNGMLIATGNTVTINGSVNGDVLAMGSQVVIGPSAAITGNLFTAGQVITVNGQVDGSLAGGSMALNLSDNAVIARNLYYGGYAYTAAAGSQVGRDIWTASYQAVLAGNIGRNARVSAAAVEVSGEIDGNATFDVDTPSEDNPSQYMPFSQMPGAPAGIKPGLRISDTAKITGKLTYTSPMEQTGAIQSQPQGGVVYLTPMPSEAEQKAAERPLAQLNTPVWNKVWAALRNLMTMMLVGLVAMWLVPGWLRRAVDALTAKPWQSLGTGFLTVIVFYPAVLLAVGIVIALIILFGVLALAGISGFLGGVGFSFIGLVVAVFGMLLSYGSKVVVAYLVGSLLLNKIAPAAETNWRKFWALLVGVVIYILLSVIPFVGWLITLAATFFGLGAIILVLRNSVKPENPTQSPVE